MKNVFTRDQILRAAEKSCQAALAKGLGTEFPSESNAIGVTATSIGHMLVTLEVLKDKELSSWIESQKKLYRDTLGS